MLDGIGKSKVLMPHYKTEYIAPAIASKTVVKLVIRVHLERRGLLLVEGAQTDVTIARPAQIDRPAYHFDYVYRLLDYCGNPGTSH
jgi:hypothetical protein